MIKVHLIAAARPNFMKVAPLHHALKATAWAQPILLHTGQHYDVNMSDVFFQDLGLPQPDYNLGIGSGSHAEQTGGVTIGIGSLPLRIALAFAISVGIGAALEWYQLSVPGRFGTLIDALLNAAGATVGLIAAFFPL